ncbi:O-antigen ligase family protein [Gloeobacter kilaueensis]|uniref:O-antigen polymerase n=1 Tax=Gloeobacter kilaueensis (strain ATCC BAA-2537 / CCAP 1431/1 / ULC 316 / JS1) TaxID=1183438 RepID=U5QI77_GLOK1|nr:O-antigen ligase family protein [Gloeobacter kilaueensis]AGY58697.1 O-antigen polymerase [Gloeobacter kilaueensis JS1]
MSGKWLWAHLDLGLLAVAYALLLVLRNSYTEIAGWPWCLALQGCLLVGAIMALRSGRPLGQPFDALAGVSIAAVAVSAALSPDPERSWGYAAMVTGYFAVLYGLVGRWPRDRSLLPWLGAAGALFSLAGLYQFWQWIFLPQWQAGKPLNRLINNIYPLGHHNFNSGLLSLLLPVILALVFERRGPERGFWFVCLLIGLAMLFSTQSRGGWLGVLVGCVLVCLLSVRLSRRNGLLLAVALPVVLLVAVFSTTFASFKPKFFFEGRDISTEQRLIFWQTGVRLWQDHPLFGVGPGVTGFVFPGYRTDTDPWMARTAQQLHNTPVHLLAETGLAGLLAYMGWLAGCSWMLWRCLGQARPIVAALAGALAGYAVSSLTDFQLENPAISLTLIALVAELVRLAPPPAWQPPSWLRLIGGGVFLVWTAFWLRSDWGSYQAAIAFAHQNDPAAFEGAITQARRIDPDQPYYPLVQAQVLLDAARKLSPRDPRRAGWILQASEAADRAAALLPTDPYALTVAGWLHYYRGQWAWASRLFDQALAQDPTTTATLQLGAGLALLAQHRTEAALPHLVAEIVLFPDQWIDERWQTGPLGRLAPRVARNALALYNQLLSRYPGEHDALYQQAMLLLWLNQPLQALRKLDAMPVRQGVEPGNVPVALRLAWRVAPYQALGVRIQALWKLSRFEEAREALSSLDRLSPASAACLRDALIENQSVAKERFYLVNGQDYFLLRRIGGPVLQFPEPVHSETWASMDCVTFGYDGRNWRLPQAQKLISTPVLQR